MNRAEQWLAILLRANGVVMLLAIPAIILPFDWMDACHRWLGLGELPFSTD
jgi:hypothetical protein